MNATAYSDINTYQRCPKKAYYRIIENLEPKKQSVNLFNGINGHEMLKVFFLALQRGADKTTAWADVLDMTETLYADSRKVMFEDELAEAVTEIDNMLRIIERYVDQFDETWEVLHVEETFYIWLGEHVISFTPDLVVFDRNNDVWIIDHKTTSRMPDTGIPFGDMQAILYYAGVQSMYPECKGFIFNRIRKKIPTQPRLTKTGKVRVANLDRIDTTYEVLRSFLQENAPALLSDPMHLRRLGQLRDESDRWFWTEQVYVNESAVNTVVAEAAAVMDQMEHSAATGDWPRFLMENSSYMSCSKCPFQSLCQGELLGWNTDLIRDESYQQRGPKNPYEGSVS